MTKSYKPKCNYNEQIDEEYLQSQNQEKIKLEEILQRVERRKEVGENIRKKKHYVIDEKLQEKEWTE